MSTAVKKVFGSVVLIGALFAALALFGCAAPASVDSKLAGTWGLNSVEVAGTEVPKADIQKYMGSSGYADMKIEFQPGDKVKVSYGGSSSSGATYTYADGKGTIKEGSQSMDFTVDDSKLKLASSGAKLVFTKV